MLLSLGQHPCGQETDKQSSCLVCLKQNTVISSTKKRLGSIKGYNQRLSKQQPLETVTKLFSFKFFFKASNSTHFISTKQLRKESVTGHMPIQNLHVYNSELIDANKWQEVTGKEMHVCSCSYLVAMSQRRISAKSKGDLDHWIYLVLELKWIWHK